jgi:hypothetical protein
VRVSRRERVLEGKKKGKKEGDGEEKRKSACYDRLFYID